MNIILDCETLDINYNHIYDLAWAVVNRNKIVVVRNYIIKEHLAEMAIGSFSKNKVAATMAEVAKGNAEIKAWDEVMEILKNDFEQATNIYAYNAPFDRSKIISTSKVLKSKYTEFFQSTAVYDKWRDLWAWASNTILYKKSFIDWTEENGLLTEKGNCKTSAETCLQFIRNDRNYVEEHTARADVLDEFEIYQTIKKEIKREFSETCTEQDEYKWHISPSRHVMRLKVAFYS